MRAKITIFLYLGLFGLLLPGCSNSDDAEELAAINQLINSGQYDDAIQQSEEYTRQYPESYLGWNELGWAYLKSDRLEEAKASFDKAIELNNQWDNAYVGLGAFYRKLDRLDEARENYLKAISIVPENAEAISSLLVIELLAGNNQLAVNYGEQAWAIRQDLPSIPANLAIANHYLGDFDNRDAYYEHARELGYPSLEVLDDIFAGMTDSR